MISGSLMDHIHAPVTPQNYPQRLLLGPVTAEMPPIQPHQIPQFHQVSSCAAEPPPLPTRLEDREWGHVHHTVLECRTWISHIVPSITLHSYTHSTTAWTRHKLFHVNAADHGDVFDVELCQEAVTPVAW